MTGDRTPNSRAISVTCDAVSSSTDTADSRQPSGLDCHLSSRTVHLRIIKTTVSFKYIRNQIYHFTTLSPNQRRTPHREQPSAVATQLLRAEGQQAAGSSDMDDG